MSQQRLIIFLSFLIAIATNCEATSSYATTVNALIASSSCPSVSSNTSICGSSSQSYAYYETYLYNTTHRVVIVSGVPDHDAEYDQVSPNSYSRCLRYQFILVPASPKKSTTFKALALDNTAFITSGAVLYSPLSSISGALAYSNEGDTLDPCYGHSNKLNQYHYHAMSSCVTGATTASPKTQIGYMLDGYPVYVYATDSNGTTLKTCWTANSTSPLYISDFYYDSAGYSSGTCHLDMANGYTFSDGTYGYVMVSDPMYVPSYYAGTYFATSCGFTP